MEAILRDHPRLAIVFVSYYVGFLAVGFASGGAQTLVYAAFVGGAAAAVVVLYRSVPLSSLALWGLAGWGAAHMAGGLVEVDGRALYLLDLGLGELRLDKIVHFFGFGFATVAAYEALRLRLVPTGRRVGVATAAWLVGIAFGGINETIEFLLTRVIPESNVGGFVNTGWDLVANALGAAVAAAGMLVYETRQEAKTPPPRG